MSGNVIFTGENKNQKDQLKYKDRTTLEQNVSTIADH